MEVQAEATLHLNSFPDKNKVRAIVRSSGLTVTELGGDRVQVRGHYSRLKAASARLKELLEAQTRPKSHFSSWSDDTHSKHPGSLTRNQSNSLPKPKSSHPPLPPTTFSQSFHHHSSIPESFPIDADVYKYADRVKNEQIQNILRTYRVQLDSKEYSDNVTLTIKGAKSSEAAINFQHFFNDLNKSLRTQDVPLKEMSRDGVSLWKQIKKDGNIYYSVLVCEKKDSLHLVGPSEESYTLKQKLLRSQTPLMKRGSFRIKKPTLHSKSPKHRVKEDTVNDNDTPVGGAEGGVPYIYHDQSEHQGPGFLRSGSKRKKEKPDRNHKDQEDTGSKSFMANLFSWFSKKSKKPKNKKDEK